MSKYLWNICIRLREPCYYPKEGVRFVVPKSFVDKRYWTKLLSFDQIIQDEELVYIKEIEIPDLSYVTRIGRKDQFSIYNEEHKKIATYLIQLLIEADDVNDLLSLAVYCRDRVNPILFYYCLSVVCANREDTKNVQLPCISEVFPEQFLPAAAIPTARDEVNLVDNPSKRRTIVIPRNFSMCDRNIEQRVAYWREDLGMGIHYWQWYVANSPFGPEKVLKKDRKGELFYFMHHELIARYNAERLCNELSRVKPYTNWRKPLEEGFWSKLYDITSGQYWAGRQDFSELEDVNRECKISLLQMERWCDNILTAICIGEAIDNDGKTIRLSNQTGIDIVGNMIQSADNSVNKNVYGNLNGSGHIWMSYPHDPDGRYKESGGPLLQVPICLRDPAFYRWHSFLEHIFQQHKSTLAPYTPEELSFPDITVTGWGVEMKGSVENVLKTCWMERDLDVSRGMEFSAGGPMKIRFIHLHHLPYQYKLKVLNKSNKMKIGTVRIFLAPKYDEKGTEFVLTEQNTLFYQLDKFPVKLNPGENVITRNSVESSVTIPPEELNEYFNTTSKTTLENDNCRCGLPNYLNIPKGTARGYYCELFVMVSNFEHDKVDDNNSSTQSSVNGAFIYCGVKNGKYPDKKPMGYPFDRPPDEMCHRLKDWMTTNMKSQQIQIFHEDHFLSTNVEQRETIELRN